GPSQRRHWYANADGDPDQSPFEDTASAWPDSDVPDTVGRDMLTGVAARTTPDGGSVTLRAPPVFVAVTLAVSTPPTSASAAVYDDSVAPGIARHPVPSAAHRCHWNVVDIGRV